MRKEDFVFVIYPREENRVANKEDEITLVSREQIWQWEAHDGYSTRSLHI